MKLLKKFIVVFLFKNNLKAVTLAKNYEYRFKIKSIEMKWHWIKKTYQQKMIEILYIVTKKNLTNGFTKFLELKKFYVFSNNIVGKLATK